MVDDNGFDGKDYEGSKSSAGGGGKPVSGKPVSSGHKPVEGKPVVSGGEPVSGARPVSERRAAGGKPRVNPAFLLRGGHGAGGTETAEDFKSVPKGYVRPAANGESDGSGRSASDSAHRLGSSSDSTVVPPRRTAVHPVSAPTVPKRSPAPSVGDGEVEASSSSSVVNAGKSPVKTSGKGAVGSEAGAAKAEPVEDGSQLRRDMLAELRDDDDEVGLVASAPTVKRRVNPMFIVDEDEVKPAPAKKAGVRRPASAPAAEESGSALPPLAKFEPKPGQDKRKVSPYRRKASAEVEVGEWTDDSSDDTDKGFGGASDDTYVEPQYGRGFHLTERDFIMMRFMARYRYSYLHQLARLVDTAPKTIAARLRILEKRGFIRREPVTQRQYLWLTRKAGNLIADIHFGEIKKGSLSYVTVAHTAGLANLGVELERVDGGKDILGERDIMPDWPPRNRYPMGVWGAEGEMSFGEQTITEREIRQAQLRWRGGRSSQEMRELVDLAISDPEGPELLDGNEGLFVVYGQAGKTGEHIPDLIVVRPRGEDGTPQHIAIELELTTKTVEEWKRILRWYRDNGGMYAKVYYFTHVRAIASALRRVADEVGMSDRLVIRKYNPQNGNAPFWG